MVSAKAAVGVAPLSHVARAASWAWWGLLRTSLLCAVCVAATVVAPLPVAAKANNFRVSLDRDFVAYIDAWRDFYPSQAFAYGDRSSAAAFENFSDHNVASWLALNVKSRQAMKAVLAHSNPGVSPAQLTDAKVLLAQAEDELATWREDAPLTHQPQWYAEQVSQALTHLLVRDQLSKQMRSDALMVRLQGVERLCRLGAVSLTSGNALRTRRALLILSNSSEFYESGLRKLLKDWPEATGEQAFGVQITRTLAAINKLILHLRQNILPVAQEQAAIGEAVYTAKLKRRTSGLYSPQRLLAAAGEELRAVRALMYQESVRWANSVDDRAEKFRLLELSDEERLTAALEAMESYRQNNSADFLVSFTELTLAAERFVEEQGIATIPKPTTLLIALSPAHFSGAAVGGVYPSGPFDASADTLFYIPSIPDDAPPAAKEGFYRSFNTHFNTMILSHEMFPGHYLQYKVGVSEAPALRSLFSNGSYVEGWGSFVEELMLDAGWANNAPLTRLAHLRKRLENATRAYVSVQVNMANWGEQDVLRFAQDEGLLAPQFATNLWQRVVNSPLQITDYFTGFKAFKDLYDEHRAAPSETSLQTWVDAVLRAGPLPMALLESEIARQIALSQAASDMPQS